MNSWVSSASSVAVFVLALAQAFPQRTRVLIPFELDDKSLKLTLWAKQPMLKNPVALSFDNQGRLFVVETARRGTVDVELHRAGADFQSLGQFQEGSDVIAANARLHLQALLDVWWQRLLIRLADRVV